MRKAKHVSSMSMSDKRIRTLSDRSLSLSPRRYYTMAPADIIKRNMTKKYVEIKCQLDATEVFIADLIACSTCFGHHYAHHQDLKSIRRWLLRVVFCAVVFQVAGLVWS